MFSFFSIEEKDHLQGLQQELFESPKDYFFHQAANVQEFKELNLSIMSWEWNYFYQSAVLLFEALNCLRKTFYSLLP